MNRSVDDPTHRNILWRFAQVIAWIVFPIWFRYRVRGLEHIPQHGPALLLINHQSYLDPLFVPLRYRRPVCYLARDDLFRVPVVGTILRATYVIPVNRDSPGKSSVVRCIQRLESGFLVGIFPEGTRTRDGVVGRFRPGFLAILRRCDVPVIPIGIAGSNLAMPRGSFWIRPRSVRVVIGPPLERPEFTHPGDRSEESELVDSARQQVVRCQAEAERWRTRREQV